MDDKDKDRTTNHAILLNMAVEEFGSPGIVTDSDVAKATSCTCYDVGEEEKMCFSKGIIGTLSDPQEQAYCPAVEMKQQGLTRRVKEFREAAREAHKKIEDIPRGERLDPWLEAMSESLSKRGIEV
ncbi:hypothetical protein AKJ59_00445 [candidate division MSBL1 archaeon SCGC-AAA385M02]|uniref:Uncharacterized protein n=1 Tax=candidate division MSBL1 archaeon SCGC-AAA385M02 TaxID=1698287 RepID=A0A133VQT2_9EURY|nr:hypothetical protein AKJ59_00445 [candidate division MSBL1 archaeon SCGC-AAA385M02]